MQASTSAIIRCTIRRWKEHNPWSRERSEVAAVYVYVSSIRSCQSRIKTLLWQESQRDSGWTDWQNRISLTVGLDQGEMLGFTLPAVVVGGASRGQTGPMNSTMIWDMPQDFPATNLPGFLWKLYLLLLLLFLLKRLLEPSWCHKPDRSWAIYRARNRTWNAEHLSERPSNQLCRIYSLSVLAKGGLNSWQHHSRVINRITDWNSLCVYTERFLALTTKRMRSRIAGIMWLVLFLIPVPKYPANPPAIGDPDTIYYRQSLYVAFLAISGFGAWTCILVWEDGDFEYKEGDNPYSIYALGVRPL